MQLPFYLMSFRIFAQTFPHYIIEHIFSPFSLPHSSVGLIKIPAGDLDLVPDPPASSAPGLPEKTTLCQVFPETRRSLHVLTL